MQQVQTILVQNKKNWESLYSKQKIFLQYPADWIIRFHNHYLKKYLPNGRVLDYGFGTGNNSIFFMDKGYDVWGLEVAESSLSLLKNNLKRHGYSPKLADHFSIIPLDGLARSFKLPFENDSFDLIISNQVLYYLPSKKQIQEVSRELNRILKPNGIVYFTMMGPKNYYIVYHAEQVYDNQIYEISFDDLDHRLNGYREFIYLVRDEKELKDLFSVFLPVDIGYFDQKMFDISSNFHWIFVGKKAKSK